MFTPYSQRIPHRGIFIWSLGAWRGIWRGTEQRTEKGDVYQGSTCEEWPGRGPVLVEGAPGPGPGTTPF